MRVRQVKVRGVSSQTRTAASAAARCCVRSAREVYVWVSAVGGAHPEARSGVTGDAALQPVR